MCGFDTLKVRRFGLMCGFDTLKDPETVEAFPAEDAMSAKLLKALQRRGRINLESATAADFSPHPWLQPKNESTSLLRCWGRSSRGDRTTLAILRPNWPTRRSSGGSRSLGKDDCGARP